MIKKALKITIFFTFVLILFSSCARKVENCKIFPKVEIKEQKSNESNEEKTDTKDKITNMIRNPAGSAQITCNF